MEHVECIYLIFTVIKNTSRSYDIGAKCTFGNYCGAFYVYTATVTNSTARYLLFFSTKEFLTNFYFTIIDHSHAN